MKILTICVPCYNNQAVLANTIESYLFIKDDVEIIIADNGSLDNTLTIAKEYQNKYPGIIKVISTNGNLGNAINEAINEASGLYFKIVTHGDYLSKDGLAKALKTLKDLLRIQSNLDMLLCNYEYTGNNMKKSKVVDYKNIFPLDKVFKWHQVKHIKNNQLLNSKALIIKTDILRNKKIDLAKYHVYTKDLFVLSVLPLVSSMYYLDMVLYHTNLTNFNKNENIDDYIESTKAMIDFYNYNELKSRKQRLYMIKHIGFVTANTMIMLTKQNMVEANVKKDELWNYLQIHNQNLYKSIKGTVLGKLVLTDNKITNKIIVKKYKLENKFIKER